MTIYNVRGACGAGKSTVVRAVLGSLRETQRVVTADRRYPVGYVHQGKRLFIAGHYERPAMGGIDSFRSLEEAFEWVFKYAGFGYDVLFEGKCQERDLPHLKRAAESWSVVAVCLEVRLSQAINGVRRRATANAMREAIIERSLRKYHRDRRALLADSAFAVIRASRKGALEYLKRELKL